MTSPKLSFPTENGRYYHHPRGTKGDLPSVTNIKRQKNQPAIHGSTIRKVAEYAADNWDRLAPLERAEKIQLIKGAQWIKNPASRIGDIVHAWVDGFIKTESPPWDLEPITLYADTKDEEQLAYKDAPITCKRMYRQFEGWCAKYEPKWLDAEFTVWSDTHGYAGTADWAAEIRGLMVLGDTKTGKAVYYDTGMQLAALAYADVMFTEQGEDVPMPKWDRLAVLHLRPTYSCMIPIDRPAKCFQAFLGLKANLDHEIEDKDHILMYAPKIYTDYKGV